jgi:hypothetical protein
MRTHYLTASQICTLMMGETANLRASTFIEGVCRSIKDCGIGIPADPFRNGGLADAAVDFWDHNL